MPEQKKKYYDELNIFRAFIIIWVVIGHSFERGMPFFGLLHSYAYTFHMDAFFILSGLLFAPKLGKIKKPKDACSLAGQRILRLFIPYLFFTGISLILKIFFEGYANNKLHDMKSLIGSVLLGCRNPNGGLWFLYSLLIISLFAVLLYKLPKWLLLAIGIGLKISFHFVGIASTYPILYIFRDSIYLFLGIFLYTYYDRIIYLINVLLKRKRALFLFITGLSLTAGFIISTYYTYLKFEDASNPLSSLLYYLAIFINVIAWYFISVYINNTAKVKKTLMQIGFYGMDIYMIGYYVQIAIRVICGSMLGIPLSVYSVFMFIFGLILPIPISKYIVRKFRITRILVLGDFKKEVKNDGKKA